MKKKIFFGHLFIDRRDIIFLIIIFVLSCYLYINRLPIPGVDDLCYKQAGVSLFKGLGFSVPALKDFLPGVEKVFTRYPPLYPFIYGLWFYIFGLSLPNSLFLSFIICASIAFIQILLFKKYIRERRIHIVLYGLVLFSWGMAISAIDRPDPLVTLLGLGLLSIIIKSQNLTFNFRNQLSIIVLITCILSASFVLGIFSMIYLLFFIFSINGFNLHTLKRFFIWLVMGVIFTFLIWAIPLYKSPDLFITQFLKPSFELNRLYSNITEIKNGISLSFKYGFDGFYIPLLFVLSAFFVMFVLIEKNKAVKNFLMWQFSGIVTIWIIEVLKMPDKGTYRQTFFAFFVLICGASFMKSFKNIKNRVLKTISLSALCLSIFIACLPSFRILAFPLIWSDQDKYEYNKSLILSKIPKGAKVCTEVRFWYILEKDYNIYDSYFFKVKNIEDCDYVLLPRGGLVKPNIISYTSDAAKFKKIFSNLVDQPNKLFGLNIARSRWCYRFELYKKII